MRFSRLQLLGFKSFVDRAELIVGPGTTGIVGPNGCGKSNLIEALRWVMGESSARQMRGTSMDHVIFAGSAGRPARNIGEVSLHLDNRRRDAPAPFNDSDEIEILRRIERDKGSTYRINGREVRARDVHLLFADRATGPRATAMVGQGRVATLIDANPATRRALLEEAAGTTGLHNRRHEAELRLRGAETNLQRLDDVMRGLEKQLATLRREERQARRYRDLSARLRQAEAAALLGHWREATTRLDAARTRMDQCEAAVATLTGQVATAAAARDGHAAALPDLRRAATEQAAAQQRLTLAGDTIRSEQARIAGLVQQNDRQLTRLATDRQREVELAADAGEHGARLATERSRLDEAATQAPEQLRQARAEQDRREAATAHLETLFATESAALAAATADRESWQREDTALTGRLNRLNHDLEAQKQALADLAAEPGPDPEDREAAVAAARTAAEAAQQALDIAESDLLAAEAGLDEARQRSAGAQAAHASLQAEADGLRALLARAATGALPPLASGLQVEPGYEKALGAALGDDLEAPAGQVAARYWRRLADGIDSPPALPAGVTPLARYVSGPDAPMERLNRIGLIPDGTAPDGTDGAGLASGLAPGHSLVTRAGDLWRWDGFTVRAGQPAAASLRLEQGNRLAALMPRLTEAAALAGQAVAAEQAQARHRETARTAAHAARQAARAAGQAVDKAGRLVEAARQQAAARDSRRATLHDRLARLETDRREAEASRAALRSQLVDSDRLAQQAAALAARKQAIVVARAAREAARDRLQGLLREAESWQTQIARLQQEQIAWSRRHEGAVTRMAEFDKRLAEAQAERRDLAERPAALAEQLAGLAAQRAAADRAGRQTSDRLAAAETALRTAAADLKRQESALGEAREARVRAEADQSRAGETVTGLSTRIAGRLRCTPEAIAATHDLPEPLPDPHQAEQHRERLLRERDAMGPVNLRADIEAGELDKQVQALRTERSDLEAAIGQLRRGIATLNREARQRLTTAFTQVDAHFQALFRRLFGGGTARLTLTDSDDPLAAGLDVLASPPGKKAQGLSLLSGGEQTLTAIALLFAVFLTNPAPICVLDEVDAPLDDANVDRFCTLVEEIVHQSDTRMLVVTHNRMTMARMDRLYGVTMPERGVSQLVSVDLATAGDLRQTAARQTA